MALDVNTFLPGIALAGMVKVVSLAIGAAQVGFAIAPAFDAEVAVGAGEFRERGHEQVGRRMGVEEWTSLGSGRE